MHSYSLWFDSLTSAASASISNTFCWNSQACRYLTSSPDLNKLCSFSLSFFHSCSPVNSYQLCTTSSDLTGVLRVSSLAFSTSNSYFNCWYSCLCRNIDSCSLSECCLYSQQCCSHIALLRLSCSSSTVLINLTTSLLSPTRSDLLSVSFSLTSTILALLLLNLTSSLLEFFEYTKGVIEAGMSLSSQLQADSSASATLWWVPLEPWNYRGKGCSICSISDSSTTRTCLCLSPIVRSMEVTISFLVAT